MFKTTDIALAAALIYHGATLRDTLGNPRVTFVFDDTPEIQEMADNFSNPSVGLGADSVQKYYFIVKSLKTRLHSIKDRR